MEIKYPEYHIGQRVRVVPPAEWECPECGAMFTDEHCQENIIGVIDLPMYRIERIRAISRVMLGTGILPDSN